MTESEPIVFVVDDDAAMCESMKWLLESAGLRVRTFDSAEAFLADFCPDQPGCLVLDVHMRGLSGLELQARLAGDGHKLPVIMLTAHGDVSMAVRAVKAGAIDFLEKPVNDQVLLERVRHALAVDARVRAKQGRRRDLGARLATLTPRERQVMDLVAAGRANKQIAAELGISEKTIEVHRRRVMEKMEVHSAVELVRLLMQGHENGTNSS
jgi:RNA polymerase sigma factor (sigma-70 family)